MAALLSLLVAAALAAWCSAWLLQIALGLANTAIAVANLVLDRTTPARALR